MQQKGTITRIRRTLAAILLALISATFLIPLAYAGDDPDASLPVCCRAHGAHRCSLGSTAHMRSPGSGRTNRGTTPILARVSDRCPFPPSSPVSIHTDSPDPASTLPLLFHLAAYLSVHPRTQGRRHGTCDRSHQKRGPPAPLLSV